MAFHGNQDGTWEIYTNELNAWRYAIAITIIAWLRHARIDGDGTLRNIRTGLKERLGDEFPENLAELRALLLSKNENQLIAIRNRLADLPWFGIKNGVVNETKGFTTLVAAPRITRDGRWAVRCYQGGGEAEPLWPLGTRL